MKIPLRRGAVVWVVLALSLAASFLTFQSAVEARRLAAEHRLWGRADFVRDLLTRRITAYEHVLLGAKGLFAASREVQPDQWSSYVGSLDLASAYPGIQALVFAQRVTAAEKPSYLQAMAALGHPDFSVKPEGDREEYFPNTFLVQREGPTDRVLGFDGYQEPVRRRAMEEAVRSGRPSLAGPVVMRVDSGGAERGGFAMYLPLYRDGVAAGTPEERRAALRGYLSAFFRLRDVMDGVTGDLARGIGFRVVDGESAGEPLYATGPEPERGDGSRVELDIPLAGRRWTLAAWELPGLVPASEHRRPFEVLAAGLLASLLVSGITGSLVQTRSRSEALAKAMTGELQVRSEQFRRLAGRAEAITLAQSDFLADMSQELRTPLTRMIGCSELLLGNPEGSLGARYLAYLSRIRDDGRHLLTRMDYLLELALIEAGRMEIDWSEVDLAALAREAASHSERLARDKGLAMGVEAPARCRPVRADAAKLRQVLLDLIGNALKGMERGTVTVRVRAEGEAPLALEVEATVHGVAPGPSDLGFTLARALVRLMGFDLEGSHRDGNGFLFSIRLPADLQPSHPAALTPRPALRRPPGEADPPSRPA